MSESERFHHTCLSKPRLTWTKQTAPCRAASFSPIQPALHGPKVMTNHILRLVCQRGSGVLQRSLLSLFLLTVEIIDFSHKLCYLQNEQIALRLCGVSARREKWGDFFRELAVRLDRALGCKYILFIEAAQLDLRCDESHLRVW